MKGTGADWSLKGLGALALADWSLKGLGAPSLVEGTRSTPAFLILITSPQHSLKIQHDSDRRQLEQELNSCRDSINELQSALELLARENDNLRIEVRARERELKRVKKGREEALGSFAKVQRQMGDSMGGDFPWKFAGFVYVFD